MLNCRLLLLFKYTWSVNSSGTKRGSIFNTSNDHLQPLGSFYLFSISMSQLLYVSRSNTFSISLWFFIYLYCHFLFLSMSLSLYFYLSFFIAPSNTFFSVNSQFFSLFLFPLTIFLPPCYSFQSSILLINLFSSFYLHHPLSVFSSSSLLPLSLSLFFYFHPSFFYPHLSVFVSLSLFLTFALFFSFFLSLPSREAPKNRPKFWFSDSKPDPFRFFSGSQRSIN